MNKSKLIGIGSHTQGEKVFFTLFVYFVVRIYKDKEKQGEKGWINSSLSVASLRGEL